MQGGVDLCDQFIALYSLDRKSRRYYLRIFFDLMEILLVNSYICFKNLSKKLDLPDLTYKVYI